MGELRGKAKGKAARFDPFESSPNETRLLRALEIPPILPRSLPADVDRAEGERYKDFVKPRGVLNSVGYYHISTAGIAFKQSCKYAVKYREGPKPDRNSDGAEGVPESRYLWESLGIEQREPLHIFTILACRESFMKNEKDRWALPRFPLVLRSLFPAAEIYVRQSCCRPCGGEDCRYQ